MSKITNDAFIAVATYGNSRRQRVNLYSSITHKSHSAFNLSYCCIRQQNDLSMPPIRCVYAQAVYAPKTEYPISMTGHPASVSICVSGWRCYSFQKNGSSLTKPAFNLCSRSRSRSKGHEIWDLKFFYILRTLLLLVSKWLSRPKSHTRTELSIHQTVLIIKNEVDVVYTRRSFENNVGILTTSKMQQLRCDKSCPASAVICDYLCPTSVTSCDDWIGLSSVLRPRQHSIGFMGDGFYSSKDPSNSIKVLKEQIVHRKIKHTISKHEHKTQQVP